MKKSIKRMTFWLLLGCVLTLPAAAQSQKIHNSDGQAEMPFVIALNNGDVLVVFNEGHHFNSDAELQYMRRSKATGTHGGAAKANPAARDGCVLYISDAIFELPESVAVYL